MLLKKVILIIAVIISFMGADVEAGGIPHPFWNLNTQYQEALKNNDHQRIISTAREIIDLFGNRMDQDARNIVTPRLQQKAISYEALKRYEDSIRVLKRYIPYAKAQGWDDAVLLSERKIQLLQFPMDLYVEDREVEENKYLGGRFEPRSGMIFGSFYDQDARIGQVAGNYRWEVIEQYYPKKNSAYLVYKEWGDSLTDLDGTFRDARDNNMGVKLALNFDRQPRGSIANVKNERAYLIGMAEYLKGKEVPVFLRFANEMNVDPRLIDYPNEYREAFRFVSTIMKQYAPNVAMVWAPNDISAKGKHYSDYYPGDDYVDWVGVSTYTNLYFQGRVNPDHIDTVYYTGVYANPVEKIRELVNTYGSRKPIMIAESGVGHYDKSMGADLTDWAEVQMRRMYEYAPMVYPELKAIFHFNRNHQTENYHYALHSNSRINDLYNSMVNSGYFLSDIDGRSDYRFKKVDARIVIDEDTTFKTYAIPPKVLRPRVEYRLNGRLVHESRTVPYTANLKHSIFSRGENELQVRVYDEQGGLLKTRNYSVYADELREEPEPERVFVEISDKTVTRSSQEVKLTISRSTGLDKAKEVDFYTEDGSARSGKDYESKAGRVKFESGQDEKEIYILLKDGSGSDRTKTFYLNYRDPDGNDHINSYRKIRVFVEPDEISGNSNTVIWREDRGVSSDKEYRIEFNESLDKSSVTQKNIYVVDSSGRLVGDVYPEYVENENTVVMRLSKNAYRYGRGQSYTLVVAPELKSESGRILGKTIHKGFSIKD